MKWMSAWGLLLLLSGPAGCAGGPTDSQEPEREGLVPGDQELSVTSEGRDRWALVHAPPEVSGSRPLPLVLALHGGGGNPEQFKPESDLDDLSDSEGFVVVYPAGTGVLPRTLLTWNAGVDCCGYARDNDVDDVGFLLAVVDHVSERAPIDPNRVYVTGHSNGAMMSYRLAAEAADRIAAAVPVAGAMMVDGFVPVRPVPILHIHSVDDPRALYDGGLGPPFPIGGGRVLHRAVLDGLNAWIERNGCLDEASVVEERVGEPGSYDDGNTAQKFTWEPCSSGAAVIHWRMGGVGHGWPGSVPPSGRDDLIGGSTLMISAAEEAWAFFSGHTLR